MASIKINNVKDTGLEVVFRHVQTKFTHLNEPEAPFGRDQYSTNLIIDPESEGVGEFQEECESLLDRVMKTRGVKKANKRRPWRDDLTKNADGENEPNGGLAISAKSYVSERTPRLVFVDRGGNPIRPSEVPVLGDGSVINLACWVSVSDSQANGATLAVWINAVQPVKVVMGGGGASALGADPDVEFEPTTAQESDTQPF